ncbi:hypothetical protein AZE42_12807 [Rhizopogon vesiculosus]|uniref:DDE Tnp4 domain-containing protein n=1 Tax=Rhizopogon vesiculosus TaxID=180088 RepID=A0A1J8R0E7_9AGAM|nr:hypothetical protein AZE42_12807 [Rhizopogon vesiculosus]
MADAALWTDAHVNDLRIPEGQYFLADTGFGTSDVLLVPYQGVHYHLKEWRQANVKPRNAEELFNHRYSALCNVIEHIFGVMKHQWGILRHVPEYSMDIQARIPAALCALHNFIQKYHPDTFNLESDGNLLEINHDVALGELGDGPPDAAEQRKADQQREIIARDMWADYLNEHRRQGLPLPG